MELAECNDKLNMFSQLIQEERCMPYKGTLKVGVDLGTANTVIAVLDETNNPVTGVSSPSKAMKDGIVVDYMAAIDTVKHLKIQLEKRLGRELVEAATAIPPGILEGNVKVITNVVEGAGFYVSRVVDEPTAAADVLQTQDGVVVDVGGGTTGISILSEGKVLFTADEATGGTHMTYVLAGYHKISFEEAEELKKDRSRERDVFPIIRPVVEKMASIVKKYITGYDVNRIYVVGGACCFSEFQDIFQKELGIQTVKPEEPLLVTPMGIAMNCKAGVNGQ